MKRLCIILILVISIIPTLFTQQIDFSINLANDGGVTGRYIFLIKISPAEQLIYSIYIGGSEHEFIIKTSTTGTKSLIFTLTSSTFNE